MSLSKRPTPFKAVNGMVWDKEGKLVACCNDNSMELCSILNAHFQQLKFDNDEAMEAQMQAAWTKDQLDAANKRIKQLEQLRAADAETLKAFGSSPAELTKSAKCGLCGSVYPVGEIGQPTRRCKCDSIVAPSDKDPSPQPNREETDRVAAEYYKSGRTLDVEFWDGTEWALSDKGSCTPTFNYDYAWRIKPKRRRVVVEIYQMPCGELISAIRKNSVQTVPADWKLLGTIEGEVEG